MTPPQGTRQPSDDGAAFLRFIIALTYLPPDQLPALVRTTARSLGADDAVVYLVDLDQTRLNPLGSDDEPLTVDGTIAGRAFRTETLIHNQEADGRWRMWIPILDSAERLGILALDLGDDRGNTDDVTWQAFGSMIGEAVVSKSAYGDLITTTRRSADVSLAAEMRWQLLPPLTFSSARVEVSGILEPAYDIAGDTFDYAVNGDRAHVAVLDAMGHGMQASRMANLAVTAYRHGRRHGVDLRGALIHIDEALRDQFGDSRYVTGQLATLDLARGALRIVNAGHPVPLHFRGGRPIGPVECAPCAPMGLGMVETMETDVALEPGDIVLLYTDGVTEARSESGTEFGADRLADLVSRALVAGQRPAEVLRQVVRAIYQHSGPELADDASLVLVRWPGG